MDTYSSLPLELERVIFEVSALSRPIDIPNLMLIAWRVKEWYVTLETQHTGTLNGGHLVPG
jgi:hypothetical protein